MAADDEIKSHSPRRLHHLGDISAATLRGGGDERRLRRQWFRRVRDETRNDDDLFDRCVLRQRFDEIAIEERDAAVAAE